MMAKRKKAGELSFSQDTVLADDANGLYAVADGVGGYSGGDLASDLAIKTVQEVVARGRKPEMSREDREVLLKEAMEEAERRIITERAASAIDKNMSTTFCGILVGQTSGGGPEVTMGWAGDTRGYRYRAATGELIRLTRDDRPLELLNDYIGGVLTSETIRAIEQSEQQGRDVQLPAVQTMIEAIDGAFERLRAEPNVPEWVEETLRSLQVGITNTDIHGFNLAEHLFATRQAITRYLGSSRGAHVQSFEADAGDIFFTVSDGVSDVLTEERMTAIIKSGLAKGWDLLNILTSLEDQATVDLSKRQKGRPVERDMQDNPTLYSGDDLGLAGVVIKSAETK